ncbi:MAG: hypothetical protein ACRDHP_04700 [Ktedonobacterales bacterium]
MMYPGNSPYPYPTYPAYTPYNPRKSSEQQAAANAEPAPDPRAARGFWSSRFGVVLAAVAVGLTLVAIVLAAIAAPLNTSQAGATPPAGFAQVYDAGLSDDGKWANSSPCTFIAQGLDVTGGTGGIACAFKPSVNADLTSQGFWLRATIAPAASIQGTEVPVILIGENEPVLFDTQGAYILYCHNDSTPCASGTTSAWHTNGFVANTITVSYDAGSATLSVFANDQLVTSAPFTQGSQPVLALGAGGDAEALFTHVSIYSASV